MRLLRARQRQTIVAGMTRISQLTALSLLALSLSGCAVVDRLRGPAAAPAPVARPSDLPGTTGAQSADALDTTTEAERAAALAAPAGGRALGAVVVALGSPAEQGFWLRSALVTVPAKGRVTTADGKSVAVDLQPGAGGALLSLAAFRALGLSLTSLPEVTVFVE